MTVPSNIKSWLILPLGWGLMTSGCVAVNTAEDTKLMSVAEFRSMSKETLASLSKAVEQVIQGAVTHREKTGAWPGSREEIWAALRERDGSAEFDRQVVSVSLNQGGEEPVYDLVLNIGTRWVVRVKVQ